VKKDKEQLQEHKYDLRMMIFDAKKARNIEKGLVLERGYCWDFETRIQFWKAQFCEPS
jgi:hypothetical protein